MTAGELIDILQAYDPEAEVLLYGEPDAPWTVEEVWRNDCGQVVIW